MRRVTGALIISLAFLTAGEAWAQRASERPQATLRATTADQSAEDIQRALRDPDVQAELRDHVRGIDTRNPFAEYDAFPLTSPPEGRADDGPEDLVPYADSVIESMRRRERVEGPPLRRPRRADDRPLNIEPVPATSADLPDGTLHLNVERFGTILHSLFRNNVNGYVMRMRQNGQTIYTLQWQWAQTPADGSHGWNPDRRQHVASISKFITAMGLTHMLDAQGIDYNDLIIDYLPDYWQPGANVDQITFAHLMNHVSGFGTGGSSGSFQTIRTQVEGGVPANEIGNFLTADYENMNFALCRILMATLGGYIDTDADFGQWNDAMWNWLTVAAHVDYIQTHVFDPAGVSGPLLANTPDTARAYAWNDAGTGWDSGILTGEAGGVAWHLSADEILDVVGAFRRGGGIVSPDRAQEILDLSYGLNSPFNGAESPIGPYYFKMGRWWNGAPDQQAEQSLVMILPDDIELVILVNSPLGPDDLSLQILGQMIYLLTITE